MGTINDRRNTKRYCVSQLIKITAMQEEYLWASAKDISIEGFSASSSSAIETLTPLFAMLELKGVEEDDSSKIIQIEAYVAWSTMKEDRCEFGATFTKIQESDKALLAAWLKSYDVQNGTEGCKE